MQMRIAAMIGPILVMAIPMTAAAQNDSKAVALQEVVVKGAKVVNRADGVTLYPTEAQKGAATNAYDILRMLTMPNIRIDNTAHAITAINNKGEVQVRINGIIASRQELMALTPKMIKKVDFIDSPGLRYGDQVAYVIDITMRRPSGGYTVGTDITAGLTALRGDGMVYGQWHRGKGEWSLSYDYSGYRLRGQRNCEEAAYTLSDGSVYTMSRNDTETLRKKSQHEARLAYNWADSTACVFQAALSGTLTRAPGDYSIRDIAQANTHTTATDREWGHNGSPVADLYFFRQLTPRQSVTVNAVGTHISTQANHYYDEDTPYQYAVSGRSTSLLSEIIYENRLKPFTLSAGLNYRYKYTRNSYHGSADALNLMMNHSLYAFAEIKGILGPLRYTLGTGASRLRYTQDAHSYRYWTLRPKLSVAYALSDGLQLSYDFSIREKVSRIAFISDATIRNNSMEWTVGNPDLRPNRETEHALRLSYNNERWQTSIDGYYKRCSKPNMAHYERTDDNKFIYTQTNQKEISAVQSMAYASYWAIPERLQIAVYGGLFRCFNFGNDYTHCYTSYFCVGSVTAYLGRLTLQAYGDNGNRFLEGETRGFSGAYSTLQAAYKMGRWRIRLSWTNPLSRQHVANRSDLLNRNLHKHIVGYANDQANSLTLSLSFRLSHGSKRQATEKRIDLSDNDNGIIR